MVSRPLAFAGDAPPVVVRALGLAARSLRTLGGVPGYAFGWHRYRGLPEAERLRILDADPRLSDRLPTSPYDSHYLHQAVWAAERIFAASPPEHVDVGSELTFVGVLSAKLSVLFVDLRPLELEVANLRPIKGDVLALPFDDRSVGSLSCLHVIEHIGLGRYGDPLNPSGTRQALSELARVLAPGGNLFLSLPIGVPRVCFNAHRVHDPREIIERMAFVDLVEFSMVDDRGVLRREASLDEAANLRYGCGLFWFRGRP